jgi:predicted methyltransferase
MRVATVFSLVAVGAALLTPASAKDADLAKAIAGSHRTPAFVARDAARKPQAELEFFGIKPTMTVVEISPGGGYWTEILAPYLKDKGTLYTTVSPRAMGERAIKSAEAWQAKLDANKEVFGKTAMCARTIRLPWPRKRALSWLANLKSWPTPRIQRTGRAVYGPCHLRWL